MEPEGLLSRGPKDAWVSWKLFRITKLLCKQTGRDNFFISRATCYTAFVILLIRIAYFCIDNTTSGRLWWGLGILLWLNITRFHIRRSQAIERWINSMREGELSIDLKTYAQVKMCFSDRIFFGILGLIFLSLVGVQTKDPFIIRLMGDSAFLLYSYAGYAMTHFIPPGKSVLARAKDKILAAAEKLKDIRIPSPLPVPQPIPVRSYERRR